ncbi:hypothetical protein N665_0198s0190 [Sinapis alba]|nr:hypothetical protein N665_0198s0190 [Sinapis alba]
MDRKLSALSVTDDSFSAFSDYNSDRSGEFSTTSSESRRLFLSRSVENSDDLIRYLVAQLDSSSSCSIDEQKQAIMEITLLSKNSPENRIKIAKAGAIKPLISLISSSDPQLQEHGVTAVLNLSLRDENKELIASSDAIKPLVGALKSGTPTAKENAACALLRLSQIEDNKIAIGRSGAIPLLVNLLETGGLRAKKDTSTALYSLCSANENKIRAVLSRIMKPLVELMADSESSMVDKSVYVMNLLMSAAESFQSSALPTELSRPLPNRRWWRKEEFRCLWRSWRWEHRDRKRWVCRYCCSFVRRVWCIEPWWLVKERFLRWWLYCRQVRVELSLRLRR